jgi:hypothetical protein
MCKRESLNNVPIARALKAITKSVLPPVFNLPTMNTETNDRSHITIIEIEPNKKAAKRERNIKVD